MGRTGGAAPGPIDAFLADLHARLAGANGGKPATYIPELGKADPAAFGIAIATVDGTVYAAGDAGRRFTIQSISKAFVYGHALDRLGREAVLAHVGVEPTGESFNSISLDQVHNRPFNPMVNAGAIATAELIEGADPAERQRALSALMARYAGRTLELDEAVYLSEKATGHRNRAIAFMMLNSGMIRRDPEEVLDLYFRQCSLLVDTRDLAVMAATIANDGVNPRTGIRALARTHVPDVLTVMNMCGMYNYAGQWSYEIGLPAKSGVSGAIILIIPGQAGIAIWSPPIDGNGNSVRGVAAAGEIADAFGLHIFGTHPNVRNAIRAEYRGDRIRSKRARRHAELRLLEREGARIRVIEAQGGLYFGSCERIVRRATELSVQADWLILDLRRILSADIAAERLLAGLAETLAAGGKTLIFAHVDADGPTAALLRALAGKAEIAATREAALEYCEDALIAARLPDVATRAVAFADLDIVEGLTAAEVAQVRALAIPLAFAAGEALAREGEEAPLFFALAEGSASIRLPVAGDPARSIRLGSVGPGMSCGEMALIERGRRSADIVADEDVQAWGFGIEEMDDLGRRRPAILIRIVSNITRDLAERLRLANNEIRALER
ncbi:glutaminase A [Sphingomonas profundi]|uniref:glutaminase A n=1 Tax=Alterirhizorhabdus profundi TaxID=2681549 RepID=UPI0012E8FC3D|nr:glutaminase A [Sphingomonas profundi]